MPQLQLPLFPEGITLINQNIGFLREGATITYVYGNLPVFTHALDDMQSFRMFTSQLYINGSASQAEICRAFGVSKISVLRSVKLYREKGMAGFFAPRICRGPAVLTPPVLEQVEQLRGQKFHCCPPTGAGGVRADCGRAAAGVGRRPFIAGTGRGRARAH